ncbi:lipid-A-disaccharide synthase [Bradyrhizobium sp. LM6.10]
MAAGMTSAASEISSPVGVVAGGGAMPFAVADSLAARGITPVLFPLRGACDPARVEKFRHRWISVGQLGRAMRLFREEGCRDLIFIGTLVRPSLSEVRVDFTTLRLLGNVIRAFRGGDDHLLSGVGRILEQGGFRMVGIRDVAPDLLMPEGCISRAWPSDTGKTDIERGRAVLTALGPFDIGQAAVVIDGHVVAVEDIEGTDALLARVARLREEGRIRAAHRARRAGEGPKERAGFALRPADDRPAHPRGRRRRGARRHCRRRRQYHRRRAAGDDRVRRHKISLRHRPAGMMQGRDPTRKIFLIATEESGDRLGSALMKVLRQRLGDGVQFVGVGGRTMAREGLETLFPIEQLSIVGFAAVVQQLPKILRLIRETVEAVTESAPDALVIIDSPDFTHRVARRVRARNPAIPIVDYVSPQLWAWRPGRARTMLGYVDHVLGLLPFEPEEYRKLGGPPCSYVGHPLIEQLPSLRPNAEEQKRRDGEPAVLLVLPGSRRSEIRHHLDVFGATLGRLQTEGRAFELMLPTTPHLEATVREGIANWPVKPQIVVGENEKRAAFRIAHAALAKSGTVTLELALSGIPMVTAYRVSVIEAFILRRAIRVSSVILANLVIGKDVIPEFLQEECTPEKLAPALSELLTDSPLRKQQVESFVQLDQIMATGNKPPSVLAADIVLATMRKGRRTG